MYIIISLSYSLIYINNTVNTLIFPVQQEVANLNAFAFLFDTLSYSFIGHLKNSQFEYHLLQYAML